MSVPVLLTFQPISQTDAIEDKASEIHTPNVSMNTEIHEILRIHLETDAEKS